MQKTIINLIVCTLFITCSGEKMNKLFTSLPEHVQNWKKTDDGKIYNRETLYNYIDGGAELYLTFRFIEVFSQRYGDTANPQNEIILDIFDMGTSADAFGIFTCEREDEEVGIGQDSEYGGGLLRFWKDNYFVAITALCPEQIAKPVMLELGKEIANAITTTGSLPQLIDSLPTEGLNKKKIRYFHTIQPLNTRYFVASENILNLNKNTDCILAQYMRNKEKGYLLLVNYLNEQMAVSAYTTFITHYAPEAQKTGFAQLENKRWMGAKLIDRRLIIVFEAPDQKWAQNLMLEVTTTVR
jgi:hypothetical protein